MGHVLDSVSPSISDNATSSASVNRYVIIMIKLASLITMGLVIYSQLLLQPEVDNGRNVFIPSETYDYTTKIISWRIFMNPVQKNIYESTPFPTNKYSIQLRDTHIPTILPLPTKNPEPILVSTIASAAFPTASPKGHYNGPGLINVPILLYHHISDKLDPIRYVISINIFKKQMQLLKDWGYTTITASQLADVMRSGGYIPLRPIIITFDDGFADVYHNAYPVLSDLGFVGVVYVISGMVNKGSSYMNVEQIRDLVANGWEIGSHSVNHYDLSKLDESNLEWELQQSRIMLEEMIGEPVVTFAYPYGESNDEIRLKTEQAGYRAGMRLGINTVHNISMLYNLNRIEVENRYSLEEYRKFLPWTNPP